MDAFQVIAFGHPVPNDSWRLRHARSLVKLLALHPERRMHREQVMELLWPGVDSHSAIGRLNQVLHAARRAVQMATGDRIDPQQVISNQNHLLVLFPDHPVWIDLRAFEDAANHALRQDDLGLVEQAMAAYGGELLPEDRYEKWTRQARRELDHLYVSLLQHYATLLEHRGDRSGAVEALRRSLSVDAANEESHVRLMRLFMVAGRRQRALQQFARLQEAIAREGTAELSASTLELHQAILDNRLDSGTSIPAASPPPVPALQLFGRDAEIGALAGAIREGLTGRGRMLLLSGDAGIGKTTLAELVVAPWRASGEALVCWGRCHPDEGVPVYWPWTQVLRRYLAEHDPETINRDLGRSAALIAQIAPEIEDFIALQPGDQRQTASRFELFDAVSSALRRIASRRPLLLVLDDLHWADRSSLLLLEYLTGEIRSARIVVLGTYRESDIDRFHPLRQSISQLTRHPDNRVVALGGLSVEDAGKIIATTAGVEPSDRLASQIHGLTEGNPFFVGEIARLLGQKGDPDPEEPLSIPAGVREIMRQRLSAVSSETRTVLEVAAVFGREFGVHLLSLVLDRQRDELVDILDSAVEANLLTERTSEPGMYRFSHALIRETLYDELGTARRTDIHWQIAETLDHLYDMNTEQHLSELAHHFYRATPRSDVVDTANYLARAGQQAMDQVGFDEASGYFARALQVLDLATPVDYPWRCNLLLALADAQRSAGESLRSRETALQAATLARRLDLPELLAHAATTVAWASMELRPYDEQVIQLLEEALERIGTADSVPRVQLLSALVRALDYSGETDRRALLGQEAVAVARRMGDPETLVDALESRLKSVVRPDVLELSLADADEIIQIANRTGDGYMAIVGHWWRIDAMLGLGNIAEVDRSLDIAVAIAEERNEPRRRWEARCYQAMRAMLAGRFTEAERLADIALEIGRRPAPRPSKTSWAVQMLQIRLEQGRAAELESDLRERVATYGEYPYYRALLTLLLLDAGRRDEARALYDRLVSGRFADVPRDLAWLPTMALLARLVHEFADIRAAHDLYALLRPWPGRGVVPDGIEFCLGSSSHYIGLLAATVGDHQVVRQAFSEAIEMHERMDALPWLAHSLCALAGWLQDNGASPDEALSLANRARQIAGDLGMTRLLERSTSLIETVRA